MLIPNFLFFIGLFPAIPASVYIVQFEFQKFSAVRIPHLGDGPHHCPDDDDDGQDDQHRTFAVEGILWGGIVRAPEQETEPGKEDDVADGSVGCRILHSCLHSPSFLAVCAVHNTGLKDGEPAELTGFYLPVEKLCSVKITLNKIKELAPVFGAKTSFSTGCYGSVCRFFTISFLGVSIYLLGQRIEFYGILTLFFYYHSEARSAEESHDGFQNLGKGDSCQHSGIRKEMDFYDSSLF